MNKKSWMKSLLLLDRVGIFFYSTSYLFKQGKKHGYRFPILFSGDFWMNRKFGINAFDIFLVHIVGILLMSPLRCTTIFYKVPQKIQMEWCCYVMSYDNLLFIYPNSYYTLLLHTFSLKYLNNLSCILILYQILSIRDELFETFRKRHRSVMELEDVQLTTDSLHRLISFARLCFQYFENNFCLLWI